ncbi:MAG: RNA-binding protein [Coxiella sp. RIFCSPHIGHO2_12_FULL_42_15]|nr:MAG: RNA-binding protein [Coxiella sp. RIFCSPHIGHO2_12_FULL_42_15]
MTTTSVILIAAIAVLVLVLIIFVIVKKNRRPSSPKTEYVNEQIYVGNLPYHISEEELRNYFSQFGATHSVRVIRNFKTGRSKGYAFVTYSTPNEARAALYAHGKEMQGRSMVVRIAKPRE